MDRLCHGSVKLTHAFNSVAIPESNMPAIEWDFDISAFLGQNMPAGGTGLDLGHYFDFSFDPQPLSVEGQGAQNVPS